MDPIAVISCAVQALVNTLNRELSAIRGHMEAQAARIAELEAQLPAPAEKSE